MRILESLEGYEFVTPTPATHARFLRACGRSTARDLRDVLGWSLPFAPETVPDRLLAAMRDADLVVERGEGLLSSRIRVATLAGRHFIHSAYPTEAADSVFFGPDTYRFAAFVTRQRDRFARARRAVDIGCGSGAGAVVLGTLRPDLEVTGADINPLALRFAAANAAAAGAAIRLFEGSGLSRVDGPLDLVVANPPYMLADGRAYRDGGGETGEGLALAWAREGAGRLAPGGVLLLYTGVTIRDGRNPLAPLLAELAGEGLVTSCEELDPDVFGEELDRPEYAGIERIAAVGAIIERPPSSGGA